ncbi:MAG: riboflavin synthase [Halobacteriota archaeon]|uniref:riboflavin synthase n=1 Tax=Halodesulfurarchaeum sp. HSR-GB TaxID=3074077 RepID=UPI00285A8EA3|nr:riboflavin synthase [Halodesulfurarchaeum sp. HSR-GB]MDR5656628.1 riboflavin synthase [Halodesulfurarchaeum sp. HSR-GB]
MFTGIVTGTGTVTDVTTDADGRRLTIEAEGFGPFEHGESIAVNGVCLTVEEYGSDWFSVFTASETLDKTTFEQVSTGWTVNLERPLAADGRFDGHVVQGHVDTTTTVEAIEQVGEDWTFTFAQPTGYEGYIASKGSVTIDGVSLTVADIDDTAGTFDIAIIPTTYAETRFGEYAVGDRVNLEVDVIAKYVERLASQGDLS